MNLRAAPGYAIGVGSGAVCLLIVAILVRGVATSIGNGAESQAPVEWARVLPWLGRTALVALAIGAIATLLALPAAWASRRMGAGWWALLCAPLLLPQYLVYASWGLLREPGTRLGAALEGAPTWAWQWAGYAQAIVGLALWSFPIAAVIIGSAARRVEPEALDALRLSGARAFRRWCAASAMVMPAILTSLCVVSVIMFGSAIPLHLARVQTYAVVVWRRLDESGWSAGAWTLALPLMVVALAGGGLVAGRLMRAGKVLATPGVEREHRTGARSATVLAWAIWSAAVVAPATAFASHRGVWHALARLPVLLGEALTNSAITASGVAAGLLLITLGTATGLGASSKWARRSATLGVYVWIALMMVPGVLVGGAVASAGRQEEFAWMPERALLIGAHLARLGGVAAVIGVAAHALESRALRDARRAHPGGLLAWWRTAGRLQAGLILASPIAGFALSLHEVEATVIAAPPGPGNLAEAVLAKLHYLRDDELSAAALALLGSGILLGVIAMALSSRSLRAIRRAAPLLIVGAFLAASPGCGARDPGAAEPIRPKSVFGGLNDPLRLVYPRCMDTDGESLWIIDKSGWVWRATLDGEPISKWKLPSVEKGFPVGVTAGPDGLIYIADTHQHRVAIYEPTDDGARLVRTLGELGEGDGQFIYPTDVAIVPAEDGVSPARIFVSEYGGNDRVSAFDGDGTFLFSFGTVQSRAREGGVVFSRPQSIEFDPSRNELIVADAVDHRLGRFTLEGDLIGWIGLPDQTPGAQAGAFRYPYGLAVREDGSVAVAEYGGCRVQIIDPGTGAGLGVYGTPGRGDGQLVSPWGVAAVGRDLFVLDSGNNRVVRFRPDRAEVSRAGRGVASR